MIENIGPGMIPVIYICGFPIVLAMRGLLSPYLDDDFPDPIACCMGWPFFLAGIFIIPPLLGVVLFLAFIYYFFEWIGYEIRILWHYFRLNK